MATKSRKVHTWHINIQAGDSAIHLLVEDEATPAKSPTQLQIVSAVLIDGGLYHHVQDIVDVIEKIETDYKLPRGEDNLKFDSVVVTHWDADHYEGIFGLIIRDMEEKVKASAVYKQRVAESQLAFDRLVLSKDGIPTKGQTLTDADVQRLIAPYKRGGNRSKYIEINTNKITNAERLKCDRVKDLHETLVFGCKYFRYDPGFPPAPLLQDVQPTITVTSAQVKTRFYVPYMTLRAGLGIIGPHIKDTEAKAGARNRSKSTPVAKRGRAAAETPGTLERTTMRVNMNDIYQSSAVNTVALREALSYDLGFGFASETTKSGLSNVRRKAFRYNMLATLFDNAQEYIGSELFLGGTLKAAKYGDIKHPAALIDAWSSLTSPGPLLCVVAGDQYVIGNAPLLGKPVPVVAKRVAAQPMLSAGPDDERKIVFRPRLKVVNNQLNKGNRYPNRNDSHSKNSASIVCVILERTKGSTSNTKESFKIHHFLGGDALWDVEGALVTWMRNNIDPAKPENWPCLTECLKLSHHGGKESTEASLLEFLAPRFIVAPVPASATYFHPHAETLAYIHASVERLRALDMAEFTAGMEQGVTRNFSIRDRYSPLLLMNYPEWFDAIIDKRYDLDAFQDDGNPEKDFQQKLTLMYATAGLANNIQSKFLTQYPYSREKTLTRTPLNLKAPPKSASTKNPKLSVAEKTAWDKAWKQETDDRRFFMGKLLTDVWEEISPQSKVAGSGIKAWKLVLGLGDSNQTSRTPSHQAWSGDDVWSTIPVPKRRNHIVGPPKPPLPRRPRNKEQASIAAAQAVRKVVPRVGVKKKAIGPPARVAKWARTADNPPDLEAGDTLLRLNPAPKDDDMDVEKQPIVTPNLPKDPNAMEIDPSVKGALPLRVKRVAGPTPVVATSDDDAMLIRPLSSMDVDNGPLLPDRFYIYSRIYDEVDAASESEVKLPEGRLNEFLSSLDPGFWVADSMISPTGTTLLADGDWAHAIRTTSLQLGDIKIKGTITEGVPDITEISTEVTTLEKILRFSSSSTYKGMIGPIPESVTPGLDDAFYDEYNLLVLGLSDIIPNASDPTPEIKSTFTLGDILSLFGPHWMENAGEVMELAGFDSDLKFELNAETEGNRNCIAFQANPAYPIWQRLQFDIPKDDLGKFNEVLEERLSFLGKIKVSHACLIVRKTSRSEKRMAYTAGGEPELVSTGSTVSSFICIQAKVTIGSLSMKLILEYDAGASTRLIVDFTDQDSSKKSIFHDTLSWIQESLGITEDPADLLPDSDVIRIRQVELKLGAPPAKSGDSKTKPPFAIKGSTITLRLEVNIFSAAFFVVITWPSFKLRAYLWSERTVEEETKMLPWLEDYMDIEPVDVTKLTPDGPSLVNFLPDSMQNIKIPSAVDFRIVEADFEAWKVGKTQTALKFRATLCSKDDPLANGGPGLDIDTITMMAERIPTGVGKQATYQLGMSTIFYLLPRDYDQDDESSLPAAKVEASITVTDGAWKITCAAHNLNFAAMYSLFEGDASDSVMDMLEQFLVPRIEFEFQYYLDKTFSVSLTGALRIGKFELDIGYWYGADKSWTFQGQLGVISEDSKITVHEIVSDFNPEIAEVLEDIEFIKNIAIPAINQDATDFDSAPVQFYMTSNENAIIMWLQLEIISDIGSFTFLLAQYKPKPKKDERGNLIRGPNGQPLPRPSAKRFLRVRLDKLPTLPNIPIVGSIGQPVDSISYVYVQDSEGPKASEGPNAPKTKPGFTRTEIDAINATLQDRNLIRFRDTKSNLPSKQGGPSGQAPNPNTPVTPEYVLLHGHHFIVVTDGQVILDHKFGGTTPDAKKQPDLKKKTVLAAGPVVRRGLAAPAAPKAQATEDDSGATMGQNKKSFPGIPITISNFGIQVKNKKLYLLIDATVLLGPIKLSLEGFGIGIPLDLKDVSFADIVKPEVIAKFDFKLSGIGVYFNAPPVMIAGCFFHIDIEDYEAYRGGLAVSILPYTLLAVGSYQKTKRPKEFKSVFVFAKLEGPLFTLEFAEISGVSAGFGYNYDLRIPTAANVQDFPLVGGSGSSNDPMELLSSNPGARSSFVNWTTAKENSLWFAIGMKVDAFQVLSVEAAAILSFSADNVKIALVGIASASMPPAHGKTKPPVAFIYVELGIVASLDIMGGSLYVGAQLTPNSYILAPDCHLTGGFALCYWFGKNQNAGDWVFTVGGYHPAFKKPAYYPDVPRLGISWNLSDVLTVRGESYFAICPKACMGGGRLLATFNSGPIYASFEAWASFLINFKPFFFVADIGINITVGCHIDLWLVDIYIEAELGADLHLQGPPFGGVAHVHFWVMGFSVYFGDQNNVPPPLPWSDFIPLIKQPGPGSAAKNTAMCVIAIEKGSADEKSTNTERETGESWYVRAGTFQFRIETKFPIQSMDYGKMFKGSVVETQPIYGRPMQLQNPFGSKLAVNIKPPKAQEDANPWLIEPLVRSLPKALWAKYSSGEDPTRAGNNINTLLNSSTASDATIDHLVGFTFRTPDPKLPSWSFPPFNAMAAMTEGVFQDGVQDPDVPVRRNALLGEPSGEERPVLKATPGPQITNLPIDKKPDVWVKDDSLQDGGFWDVGPSFDEIETVWQGVDEAATQVLAEAWGDVMGWWGPAVQVPVSSASSLSGKKPTWLMGDDKRFETFYLEAPWLTAEVVAPKEEPPVVPPPIAAGA